MKKFIVIEGLDKVGKSTLIENLKKSWFASKSAFFNFPSSDFSYLRNLTKDFENTTQYVRDLAHALSHGLTYIEIKKIKNSVDYIICDRYFYSSLIYSDWHRQLDMEFMWMDPSPPKPDVIIYLYSDKGYPDFASTRGDDDPNDSMPLEKRQELHEEYLHLFSEKTMYSFYENENLIVNLICVDGKTPNDVFHETLRTIFK